MTYADPVFLLIETAYIAVAAYFGLILILRLSGKRTLADWNIFDFVVSVTFGSMLASIILLETVSVIHGLVGLITLVLLQTFVSWLDSRFEIVGRIVKAKPCLLVYDGEILRDQMRKERVSAEEIRATLRSQGIGSLEQVKAVVLEANGSFSVVRSIDAETPDTLDDVRGMPR